MAQLYFVPEWFFGYNIFLEIIFFLITMVVASYSFKVYRASSERNSKLFSLAFILIALSYFTLAILNLIFLSVIRGELRVLSLDEFTTLKNLAIYSYIALFILGFATLL